MSSPPSLPEDPRLREVAEQLAATRWAASVVDDRYRLVWVSEEMANLLGEHDEGKLGYGKHLLEAQVGDTWCQVLTEGSHRQAFEAELPIMIEGTPGGKEALLEMFGGASIGLAEDYVTEEMVQRFIEMQPVKPPPVWVNHLEFVQGELPPVKVTEVQTMLYDKHSGEFIGRAFLYGPALAASVLSLVARGDEEMFQRMARLIDPGRRQAAVLFADLEASAVLSRRLPSSAYFKLVRAITTAMDEQVVTHTGIVGKHAGDGVTAFFLAEDLGSPSAAARAAIEAGRGIIESAKGAAGEIRDETGLIELDDCVINVGIHWGGALYMGQLVTGGRLEATALGDEVNECARIQETAREGKILASKALVERLTDDDARALGLDPDAVLYCTIGDMPEASPKAKRDAGGIPVTPL
ncbi:MAG: adenylate/guanylate cyclase domain-containing protein [Actinomycetota bacterium]|nr:adenylate/guanylate cyclase domain-containing protein [Actinomycetota bacterium]